MPADAQLAPRSSFSDYNAAMTIYNLHRGEAPLLISLPHDGVILPDALAARMTPSARELPDTDWHVARLYAFAHALDASILTPRFSRYVVDLNRPADDSALYPGQASTGLCPRLQFSGEPVYLEGEEPDVAEIAQRIVDYWQPYHDALSTELDRLRSQHGRVVLWEAHSIRSELPFLFEGRLPDFSIGSNAGRSCSVALQQRLMDVLTAQSRYSFVANDRFKGGYITRQHGRPEDGIEAVQLELTQRTYMDEASREYRPEHAAAVQGVIDQLLRACLKG